MAPAVSKHAVERYRDRWRPELSLDDAGAQLRALVEMAKPIRETSRRKGDELWAVGNVKLVITRNTTDRAPLVVTVLPHTPIVDVDAEMREYIDEDDIDEDGGPLTPERDAEAHNARAAYRAAGHDMHVAEALIADGKEMLSHAERRRVEARDTLIRIHGRGMKR